jgi:hypothetical protein
VDACITSLESKDGLVRGEKKVVKGAVEGAKSIEFFLRQIGQVTDVDSRPMWV